jgi:putative glycerol kinase 5
LYPLVGWRINGRTCFVAEAGSSDTAIALDWARSIGLFESVDECSALAESVPESRCFFVPAFGGLQVGRFAYHPCVPLIQAPINDDKACCAFIGLSPDTTRAHMVRAILESIAFRLYQIWTVLCEEIDFPVVDAIR